MKKLYYWFKKWKLLDTSKYIILPRGVRFFTLSDKESAQAGCIYEKFGTISYTFTPTGIGNNVKVTSLKTGEEFDITDYNRW